jgi:hypothetical protein
MNSLTPYRSQRWASLHRGTLVLAIASLLALVVAAPALAWQPKGDFAVFAQCPLKNPEVNQCFYAASSGGELAVGSKTMTVNKTITLQGGIIVPEEPEPETFVAAANGETLSKTPLTVPDGLNGVKAPETWPKGLQETFNKSIAEGFTGVTGTAELVGNPGISQPNLLFEEGVALSLPVRIKLSNVVLGAECFIGSKSSPVTLELTTGITSPPKPNKPISGAVGELELKDQDQLLVIKHDKLVDNAFAAPGAEGCGGIYASYIDPLVNSIFGLPAAAGNNTMILEGTLENAAV